MRPVRILLPLAASLVVAGCEAWRLDPDPVILDPSTQPPDTALHTWLYYPETDGYLCLDHGHGYVRTNGTWKKVGWLGLADRSGPGFEIEEFEDVPCRYNGFHRLFYGRHANVARIQHEWVYYPGSRTYVCALHAHAFRFDGRGWRRTALTEPMRPDEPFLWIGDAGPAPYLRHEEHRLLWEERREPILPPRWRSPEP